MNERGEVRGRTSKARWTGLLTLLVALVLLPSVWLLMPRRFLGEALPNPNGYDDLIAAGRLVTGNFQTVADLEKSKTDDLRALVELNRVALERARVGLDRKSVVPLSKSPTVEAHLENFNALRALGRLLVMEAALKEREGHTTEAANLYKGVIRYAPAMSNGGLIVERMAVGPIQYAAIQGLNRLGSTFSADETRRLVQELEQLDRDRESLNRVFARDLEFHLTRNGLAMRASYALNRPRMQAMLMPARAAAERGDRLNQAELRLLASKLALRAFRLDHPDQPLPSTLDALVPDYLSAVPADPFSKEPLKFKALANDERLYSVGPNGRDDGGISGPSRNASDGDLMLTPP